MELPELLLIDKPAGITSFDVIRQLRKATGVRKFGHAGTLDPAATGLMLLGVESGTKKLAQLTKLDKEYVAEIMLGESRTTGDMDGEVRESVVEVKVTNTEIAAAVADLTGQHELPVSAYSAIKVDGVPMYKRARAAAKRGEEVAEVPMRLMTVHEVELIDVRSETIEGNERVIVTVRFVVASGTYIRSLAEELGRRLGYPAVLASLRRTQVGEYRIEDAVTLESFEKK